MTTSLYKHFSDPKRAIRSGVDVFSMWEGGLKKI